MKRNELREPIYFRGHETPLYYDQYDAVGLLTGADEKRVKDKASRCGWYCDDGDFKKLLNTHKRERERFEHCRFKMGEAPIDLIRKMGRIELELIERGCDYEARYMQWGNYEEAINHFEHKFDD